MNGKTSLQSSQQLPILYSFRRCPYAMRARMSIVRQGFRVEHREVILRDRPAHMMQISPKGTVPILLLPNGTVIEESLEIMQYVLDWQLDDYEKYWIDRNDNFFKYNLDRYKYPNRFDDIDLKGKTAARKNGEVYLEELNSFFESGKTFLPALNDALFPFVRQFANHDREWFDAQPWVNLHDWLANNLASEEFKICMHKNKQWQQGDDIIHFPHSI